MATRGLPNGQHSLERGPPIGYLAILTKFRKEVFDFRNIDDGGEEKKSGRGEITREIMAKIFFQNQCLC